MALIKTLTTGVGVVTTVNVDNGVPQFLQVGNTDTPLPLSKFEVSVSGRSTINISVQALIQAFSQYLMESLAGADVKVGQCLIISNGFLAGKNAQVKLTNAGATTPNIYVNSIKRGDAPVLAGQDVINDLAFENFDDFTALIFDGTNLDYADILFQDGHKDKFTQPELAGMFARNHQCDADGLLSGMTVIDNKAGNIESAELYANGGSITVLTIL